MPELPDVELYLHALRPRIIGRRLERVRLASPFLLRSVEPRLTEVSGRRIETVERLGKRIVFGLDEQFSLVLHLMIAGRLKWFETPTGGIPRQLKIPKRSGLASFDFEHGSLLLTEAGTKKRASLYVTRGAAALQEHDPGGIDPLSCSLAEFRAQLAASRHTVKRSLTDPRTFSGIGNAYSDEILHTAKLSPFKRSPDLEPTESERLWQATREILTLFRERLIEQHGDRFPKKVTAFLPEMAVHGKFGEPCPVCESPVQRIVYANNEANYCARCQTGGRLLSDRALTRLLKDDWPKTLEELEERSLRSRA